ncbi:MAG TPA: BsuPI-related putative proteinase inhibitor [Longimicrobiaceae bacterium]|nr:BsuPI-related putative proteinase inhibitor [Longimicrobiaceae bacterium]
MDFRPLLLVLLAACSAPAPPSAQADAVDSAAAPDTGLAFRAQVPAQARAGEPVPIKLRLTNTGAAPREVYLTGRTVTFDVVVERAGGEVVWRRLEGETVQSILQVRTLAPGESLEFDASWDQRTNAGEPVPPGDYVVRGILPTDDARLRTPDAPLRIVPG